MSGALYATLARDFRAPSMLCVARFAVIVSHG